MLVLDWRRAWQDDESDFKECGYLGKEWDAFSSFCSREIRRLVGQIESRNSCTDVLSKCVLLAVPQTRNNFDLCHEEKSSPTLSLFFSICVMSWMSSNRWVSLMCCRLLGFIWWITIFWDMSLCPWDDTSLTQFFIKWFLSSYLFHDQKFHGNISDENSDEIWSDVAIHLSDKRFCLRHAMFHVICRLSAGGFVESILCVHVQHHSFPENNSLMLSWSAHNNEGHSSTFFFFSFNDPFRWDRHQSTSSKFVFDIAANRFDDQWSESMKVKIMWLIFGRFLPIKCPFLSVKTNNILRSLVRLAKECGFCWGEFLMCRCISSISFRPGVFFFPFVILSKILIVNWVSVLDGEMQFDCRYSSCAFFWNDSWNMFDFEEMSVLWECSSHSAMELWWFPSIALCGERTSKVSLKFFDDAAFSSKSCLCVRAEISHERDVPLETVHRCNKSENHFIKEWWALRQQSSTALSVLLSTSPLDVASLCSYFPCLSSYHATDPNLRLDSSVVVHNLHPMTRTSTPRTTLTVMKTTSTTCEREGIVGGDEGPVGGVAQVICHGVKVVGEHGEEGQEKTVKCGER